MFAVVAELMCITGWKCVCHAGLEEVLKRKCVSRVLPQTPNRFGGELRGLSAGFRTEVLQEVFRKELDVIHPFSERRHLDRDNI